MGAIVFVEKILKLRFVTCHESKDLAEEEVIAFDLDLLLNHAHVCLTLALLLDEHLGLLLACVGLRPQKHALHAV